jgi:hypothetical protein
MVRAEFLVDAVGLAKVAGTPFRIAEVEGEMLRLLDGGARPSDRDEGVQR